MKGHQTEFKEEFAFTCWIPDDTSSCLCLQMFIFKLKVVFFFPPWLQLLMASNKQ